MSDAKHKMSAGKLKKPVADLKKLFNNVTDSLPTEHFMERRLQTLTAALKKVNENDVTLNGSSLWSSQMPNSMKLLPLMTPYKRLLMKLLTWPMSSYTKGEILSALLIADVKVLIELMGM